MDKIPLLSEDLLKELDLLFPHRCPSLALTDREIWFKAGQRAVVDFLLAIKTEADENILAEGD